MTPELTPDAAKRPERIYIQIEDEDAPVQTYETEVVEGMENIEYLRADTTPRWVSVKERLPETQGPHLVIRAEGERRYLDALIYSSAVKGWLALRDPEALPTHWLSNVPPLPKEESNPPRKEE
jgi:hypothetical protein